MDQSVKIESIQNLDDVIHASDYMAIGTLSDIETFKTGETLYSLQVEKQFKGHSDSTGQIIDVASQVPMTVDNKQYLLFLDYIDSERFSSPIYTSIIHSNPISENKFA